MSEEFKAITTQEEFDKAIQSRLKRQKEQFSDYDDLKNEIEDLRRENSQLKESVNENQKSKEDYEQQISSLSDEISTYKLQNMKLQIALEKGLPFNLASRIQGDDEETMRKDAETLASILTQSEPEAPLKNTEEPMGEDGAYRNLLNNLELEGE